MTAKSFLESLKKLIYYKAMFVQTILKTPLGDMIAVANDDALYMLEFTERTKLDEKLASLKKDLGIAPEAGRSAIIDQIEGELKLYFAGTLHRFKTPLALHGTDFQKKVWQILQDIPYGETWSYGDLARSYGNPKAFRAVANANGANRMPLIIPCHRVINTGGKLGGYSSGLERKSWLLEHEKKFA